MTEDRISDRHELELRIFYSVIVAGKSAKFANDVIHRWSKLFIDEGDSCFEAMRKLDKIDGLKWSFEHVRTGNYNKVFSAMHGLIHGTIDLETCGPEELEQIKGIGPKTSRFFIMWTRPDALYAALDVHILRWLHERHPDIPRTTPQSKSRYRAIESLFLQEAEKQGKTPRELDCEIWDAASTAANITP